MVFASSSWPLKPLVASECCSCETQRGEDQDLAHNAVSVPSVCHVCSYRIMCATRAKVGSRASLVVSFSSCSADQVSHKLLTFLNVVTADFILVWAFSSVCSPLSTSPTSTPTVSRSRQIMLYPSRMWRAHLCGQVSS
jgi:hypothetical protein